tara:strand:+ start:201 stop:1010 length:810 start_codon:yes stop_codon:yes gene_type:complete
MISFNSLGNLGRLGNQMFQYASLKGIARNRGFEFTIPERGKFGQRDINVREDPFNIYEVFCDLKPDKIGESSNEVLMEKVHGFDEDLFNNCPDNVDLFGYYQSPKYFEHIQDEIKREFTFGAKTVHPAERLFDDLELGDEVISLHIRRGDYIYNPNHPVQSIEYYEEAIKMLSPSSDIPVIVFSDDWMWCNEQKFFEDDRFLISSNNEPDFDMCLMSMCNYHVIANSSFSWWGAWLGNSQKIIAPKNWFGAECVYKEVDDMVFGNWSWL